MKLITLSNLNTFATEIKAKYAPLSALETLQNKVDGLVATGGEANVLEGVKVNGTALTIAEKMVDILVATGTENGTISVNNANVAVAGLQALAFKANISESDLDAALLAVLNGKAAASDVTALAGRVTKTEEDITKLNGNAEVEGSVDYKIAQAVASIMENPDETMNSIQELVDWVNDHATDALELSNQVSTNKTDIANLTALVGALPEGATSTTVVGYIAEAIGALGIGDYAKTSEVTNAISTALASYYTKTEIDNKFAGYSTTAQMEAADAKVLSDAKDYADGLAGNYDGKGSADAALTAAKSYADGLNGAMDTRVTNIENTYVAEADIETVTEAEVKALLA